jgi:hypothetical protein
VRRNFKAHFAGPAYEPAADRARLSTQVERIRLYMLGVEWRTVAEIQEELEQMYPRTCFPPCSISAQLRNLKKAQFGSHRLEKRRRGMVPRGLWEFRLLPPIPFDPRPQGVLFPKQSAAPR